ncbi:hypothetical protein CMQ_4900 [Grosmannia clavigera kw1407]|uniref:Uncharacterized protein n=1 Tax=Grosmannia clavigera (strain kw1407 / UAMH 11150) TaxID=655863 RepID=F0XTL2_GROCL|nr:uncharacterized protein CMQ_4900 [Grosmannia clavigera kw1407]EFW99048.1 hypothetical protein CMQ_4900 [Grosmannia clavigera kw1407]
MQSEREQRSRAARRRKHDWTTATTNTRAVDGDMVIAGPCCGWPISSSLLLRHGRPDSRASTDERQERDQRRRRVARERDPGSAHTGRPPETRTYHSMSARDRHAAEPVADLVRRPFSFPGKREKGKEEKGREKGKEKEQKRQKEKELKQKEQQQQEDHHRLRSRFVEGSMSDRASAAPPVAFLGPEAVSAFYAPPVVIVGPPAECQPAYPRSSLQSGTGSTGSFGSGLSGLSVDSGDSGNSSTSSRRPASFLAPLFDGVRWLHWRRRGGGGGSGETATMSSGPTSAPTAVPAGGGAVDQATDQTTDQTTDVRPDVRLAASPPVSGYRPPAGQPSAEEVLANYQQLMQSGFFRDRAIPATRLGLTRGERAESKTGDLEPMPQRTADDVLAVLAQSLAGDGRPAAADVHDVQDVQDVQDSQDPQDDPPTIVRRGTKRGHADVEPAAAGGERYKADTGRVITTARSRGKLVKKLRRTTSRTDWEGAGRHDAAVSVHQVVPPMRHMLTRSSRGGLREREREDRKRAEAIAEAEAAAVAAAEAATAAELRKKRRAGGAVMVHQDGEGRRSGEARRSGEMRRSGEVPSWRRGPLKEQFKDTQDLQDHDQHPAPPQKPISFHYPLRARMPAAAGGGPMSPQPTWRNSDQDTDQPLLLLTKRMSYADAVENVENMSPTWQE